MTACYCYRCRSCGYDFHAWLPVAQRPEREERP
jgi:hypothetical protein